ncbi:MAG: DUF2851 family protein [Bacteroidota bacterium]|nr:DUF2851 family protein [Bacteroidota bacterium]
MNERLLQFIWQFQYFNKSELTALSHESVQIIFPGHYNTNQGPDFTDARIRIGNTIWVGTVELHTRTSDWKKHNHHNDRNYNNVILHVVWENDFTTNDVPVIELKSRVSKILLQRYQELLYSSAFIPCEKSIHSVPGITWKSWKERLMAERLLRKAKKVETYLQQNNYHWEETFWWLLARSFGMRINADTFEAIARSIPLNLLAKQKHQVQQLEALLLGQAGLLGPKFKEDYPRLLHKEYTYQRSKYKIGPVHLPLHFLRMRPGNFPTVRLAQLAMLVYESAHLFSKIKEAGSVKEVRQWLDVTANDYWHYHYRFDEKSPFKKKKLGAVIIDTIIINTVIPVLFAYGNYHNDQKYKDKAVQWLEETSSESNSITKGFDRIGIKNKNAYDSQGLIELKNEYCDKRRCLECSIGNTILSGRVKAGAIDPS